MRIHVAYRTNEECHPGNEYLFNEDYVYDLSALRQHISAPDPVVGNYYTDIEARAIIQAVEAQQSYTRDMHDKYTFFDTPDERAMVLSDDQNIKTADFSVTIYLNA